MVGAHPHIGRPATGVQEHFLQMLALEKSFHWFPELYLGVRYTPNTVDLLLQRMDSVGQAMGGHVDSCQTLLLQNVDFVGQSCHLG
jgi:hypothetical protein